MESPMKFSILAACGAAAIAGSVVLAQQNSTAPQPRANGLPPVGPAQPKFGRTVPRPEGMLPKVPDGFTVSVFAELRAPRMMAYAPNGDLFVSSPAANSITVLRDTNNDGVVDERGTFAEGAPPPGRAGGGGGGGRGGGRGPGGPPPQAPAAAAPAAVNPTINGAILGASAPACAPPPADFVNKGPGQIAQPFGIAFNNGYLYVGNTGSLVRYKYTPGDLKAQGEAEKLMDLPTGGHSTRNVIFNRAGTKMYVAVGSQSNNNAGEDCRRAAILEFNPDGSGYRVFASGIRNPVGLAWQPGTSTLWTAMNERDNLGDDLVPDYAASVKDGGFYGWPYSYIGRNYDPRYTGAFPDLVNKAIVPDVLLPAHSAALGVTFYEGNQFPQRYRNGGFVALHGSWNRSVANGYKVVFFPMNNGRPGPIEDFVSGMLSSNGENGAPIEAWGRPVGVITARDGSLLVSDDGSNVIWRIAAKK
jgi:glucose/arabinose dehydrogenase